MFSLSKNFRCKWNFLLFNNLIFPSPTRWWQGTTVVAAIGHWHFNDRSKASNCNQIPENYVKANLCLENNVNIKYFTSYQKHTIRIKKFWKRKGLGREELVKRIIWRWSRRNRYWPRPKSWELGGGGWSGWVGKRNI